MEIKGDELFKKMIKIGQRQEKFRFLLFHHFDKHLVSSRHDTNVLHPHLLIACWCQLGLSWIQHPSRKTEILYEIV